MPLSRRALAIVLLVVSSLTGVAPAFAQTTALFIDSEPGDPVANGLLQTWTEVDGTFTVNRHDERSLTISFRGPSFNPWWNITFFVPDGAALAPGSYAPAARVGFNPFIGLDVTGNGGACSELSGRFVIRELVEASDGTIVRFAADFEQHCRDVTPALFGAVRYNSTISDLNPFGGDYPKYSLSIAPPAGGLVTGPGISCGNGQTACTATYAAAVTATLTAIPDPGYIFTGWTGACSGEISTVVNVNSVKDCGATFDLQTPVSPRTLMVWDSEVGDMAGGGKRHVLSSANSRWHVSSTHGGNQLELVVDGLDGTSAATWSLGLRAPGSARLTVGTYTPVTGWPRPAPLQNFAAMFAWRLGASCGDVTGRFTIHDIAFNGDGSLQRLAVDLEQHCDDTAPALHASVRYNSAMPDVEPFGGNYPRYELSTVPPLNGMIAGPGISCGGGQSACLRTFSSAAAVELTAIPDDGYVFAGWIGACREGAPTTTVHVNSVKECGAAFQPLAPSAPRTLLVIDSQEGDFIGIGRKYVFSDVNSAWSITPWGVGGVRFVIDILQNDGGWARWDLEFVAPIGETLAVGTYAYATSSGPNAYAALAVSAESRGCSRATGRFIVHDIAFDGSGNVVRFAADLEQHCDDNAPGLFAALRYNTLVSGATPFGGHYPRYELHVRPPVNGTITGDGIACGGSLASCVRSFDAATHIALTATPDPGFLFAGWTGACAGQTTMTVHVNSVKLCGAAFVPVLSTEPATILVLDSLPDEFIGQGQRRVFSPDGSQWVLSTFGGEVRVQISSTTPTGGPESWSLAFAAASGSVLIPGSYGPTLSIAAPGFPGLRIGGAGRGCSATGRFIVYELVYATDGSILRFAADAEQRCEGGAVPLFAAVRYNSAYPDSRPFEGQYPTFGISLMPPANGMVTGAGLACGNGQNLCGRNFAGPTAFTLTATPAAGYLFAGWSGDCAGPETTTIPINTSRTCTAHFESAVPTVPRTLLFWKSEAGDSVGQGKSQIYSPANSIWNLTTFDEGNGIELHIDSIENDIESRWRLYFSAPYLTRWPATYPHAARWPFNGVMPGMDVGGNGSGCGTIFGSFVVHEVTLAPGTSTLTSLALDFEQRCTLETRPALKGQLRYNSLVPVTPLNGAPILTCTTPDPFIAMGGGTCYNGGWLPPGMPIPGGGTTPPPPTEPPPSTPPPTSGCTTPDPFAAMGGGTCYNGGWLPPGMPIPGGGTPTPPTTEPPPTTPPPSSPPPATGCSTPDPFAAMGGGTCYNGGWLPPGMPIPGGGTPTPPPSEPPPTAPPPSSPPPATGCSTPDPFAAMGGGTCYNGGWLPPGMPIPGGGTSTPLPSEPPPTTPPPSSPPATGCSTLDPFVALGGGTCYNGGWLPPGMPIPGGGTP